MILEESKHARNIRVFQRVAHRVLSAILTIGLLSMDLFIVFSSSVAHRSIIRNHTNVSGMISETEMITLDVGPLITRMCNNATHHGGFHTSAVIGDGTVISEGGTVIKPCIFILFYQVPLDDYAASSATLMLALWVPIIAGLIATRITFWRVHSLLQFLISCGYLGVIYILLRDGYAPGISAAIILGRVSWTAIFTLIFVAMTIIKCCREKYCTDVRDEPAIIGLSYTRDDDEDRGVMTYDDSDDSDDMLSARYWKDQQRIEA